jgi:hypothetical protein
MRRTVVVEGPLAFRMRRVQAAQNGEVGLQILSLPMLASRLAGGFRHLAGPEDIEPAISGVLADGGFAELEPIRALPGMTRALARTLRKIWNADLDLDQLGSRCARLADLATIQSRIRTRLSRGALLPRDLCDAALNRVRHAPAVLARVELSGVATVEPVWRPFLIALQNWVEVEWRAPPFTEHSWFSGRVTADPRFGQPREPHVVTCADPRAEVVEALRWIRDLMASERVPAADIAMAATSPEQWDGHILSLASDAELPVHFSHGIPALATRDGQRCGALADILLYGLSQERVRRLVRLSAHERTIFDQLPLDWLNGLPRDAGLLNPDHWQRALQIASTGRADGVDLCQVLMPIVRALAGGPPQAESAGKLLLRGRASRLWSEALRAAPAKAIELSLRELRIDDDRDPGNCVVWCPASHLIGAPRPWTRLFGLSSQSWPRQPGQDPLVPDHILLRGILDPTPLVDRDRRAFEIISAGAASGLVLSRGHRRADGALVAPSPILTRFGSARPLARTRIPEHAFSEADRLLARPTEAARMPRVAATTVCWQNWHSREATAHDGLVRTGHPIVMRALDQVQSATSLRKLLRDPLGFVWRYALGWHSIVEEEEPLSLDPRAFGELVHELLRRAVDALEPDPGFGRAARHEVEAALGEAVQAVHDAWPLSRSVPPPLLWRHTLDLARELGLRALTLDPLSEPGTRSWTELPFGEPEACEIARGLPWDATAPVEIPSAGVRIRGRVDRLDLRAGADAVRLYDYKTGPTQRRPETVVVRGGTELQRVLYALAARQLLPETRRIVACLIYLGSDVGSYRLPDVDGAVNQVSQYVRQASALLAAGKVLPGPDAREEYSDSRLALPANPLSGYFRIKQVAFAQAFGDYSRIWNAP